MFSSELSNVPTANASQTPPGDPAGGNGQLLLYVRLGDGVALDDALRRRISTALRTDLSPRHVPDLIAAVPVVPHNRTGKKLELPVKKILLGAG